MSGLPLFPMTKFVFCIVAFALVAVAAAEPPPETGEGAEKLALAHNAARKSAEAQKALALLKGLEDVIPELSHYVFFVRGEALFAAGRGGAAEMFLRAADSKPLETEALERAAAAFEKWGKRRSAEETYRMLVRNGNGGPKDFYLKKAAQLAEKNGHKKEAAEMWERLWREHPLSGFSDLAAGRIATLRGESFPSRADLVGRADALFEKRKWKAALAIYRDLPPGAHRNARMAACIYRTGRKNPSGLKKALSLLENARSAEGIHTTGVVLEAMAGVSGDEAEKVGKIRRARDAFRSVHKRFPGSLWAGKALMREQKAALQLGAAGDAEKIYQIIKGSHPSLRADAAWRAGWAYYRAGDYEKAERIFSENSRNENSFLRGQFEYWTARIAEKKGDPDGARRIFKKVARGPFSYYSQLASRRTGAKPSAHTPAGAGNGEPAGVRRARLLFGAGLDAWAKAEARLAAKEHPGAACGVLAAADNFHFCIKLAGTNPPPEQLRLAFPRGFEQEVKTYSARNGLDENLVYSLIREESRFVDNAISVANAFGLMQIIMPTAREVASEEGVEIESREDLFVPSRNIRLGTRYLGRMLKRFNGDVPAALAAYNAGPSRAKRWKQGALKDLEPDEFTESVPFYETRNYIRRIFRSYGAYTALYPSG